MITSTDLKFLKLAETMSTYSDYPRVNIGACLVHKKSVISTGCNKIKSHPQQLRYNELLPYSVKNPRLHTEMDCLVKSTDESKGATLYIFRRGRDGLYRNCKPCEACMGKIVDSGVSRVVHTIANGIQEMFV